MKLNQRMTVQMKLSPQMVVAGKLLRASEVELENILADEIAANPALSVPHRITDPGSTASAGGYTGLSRFAAAAVGGCRPDSRPWDGDDPLERLPARSSIFEQLSQQIRQVSSGQACAVALALLTRLDERGYLPLDAPQLAEEFGLPVETINSAIHVLHNLEPSGIGAHDLRQCLLLQCRALDAGDERLHNAGLILQNAWDDFLHQRWTQVSRKTKLTRTAVKAAINTLRQHTYPRPLDMLEPVEDLQGEINPVREPDLIIYRAFTAGRPVFRLEIPGEDRTFLKISETYSQERWSTPGISAHDRGWIRSQAERANQVLQALRQRWDTLRRLGEYLLAHQRAFLEHGALHLKPMTRQDVSRALGLHPSTICRAVLDKTVQLPDGSCRPLSDFFDISLPVKERIAQIQAQSPCRLSHREICERLGEQGIQVARRTVAKYSQGAKLSSPQRPAPQSLSNKRLPISTQV